MFHDIFEADASVADVSFMSPNIYYELGVRHVLNKNTTPVILINSFPVFLTTLSTTYFGQRIPDRRQRADRGRGG